MIFFLEEEIVADVTITRRHPLDPLAPREFHEIVAIVRRDKGLDEATKFTSIRLREPDKAALAAYDATGTTPDREADVVCWTRPSGEVHTAVVSLTENTVVEWIHQPGKQANLTEDELLEVDRAMRAHPAVVEALAKRGITNLDLVAIEVWGYPGYMIPEHLQGRRIGWTDIWRKDQADSNIYAHSVSGLSLIVDLNTMDLIEIQDRYSFEPPPVMGEYRPELVPGQQLRSDIKPLDIVQPDGPSFTMDGNLLKWQNWSMRVGFNNREGMILHQVSYNDHGTERSIANRMSFAEMIVPYRDNTPDHNRRTAYDIGEWGLGFMTTSLELGCDCLGEIRYLDACVHDWDGNPQEITNAICIHEEDDAILWKHVDPTTGAEVRRARRFVVSFHATVANYEYIVYWRFYMDGNIECEVRATGIMVTNQFPHGQPPATGTVVDTDTYAPWHQHFIVARLDLDIDGTDNTVVATECYPAEVNAQNEYGLAMHVKATALTTEQEGKQDFDWNVQRSWKVVNPNKKNRLGTPVGYKLVPEGTFPALMHADSPLLKRSRVLEHSLWVTPYNRDEQWPSGDLVVQSTEDDGIGLWTEQNRPIENRDVVLWYVFGINHVTRPEEWPIMAVDKVAFWLKPVGFFDRNPSLDVPAQPKACGSGQTCGCGETSGGCGCGGHSAGHGGGCGGHGG